MRRGFYICFGVFITVFFWICCHFSDASFTLTCAVGHLLGQGIISCQKPPKWQSEIWHSTGQIPLDCACKHVLQMGTRCWHQILDSVCGDVRLNNSERLPRVSSALISALSEQINNSGKLGWFNLGWPSPTWMRQNTYPNVLITIFRCSAESFACFSVYARPSSLT